LLARQHGLSIQSIRKRNFRKEDRIARILQTRGTHPGLIHIKAKLGVPKTIVVMAHQLARHDWRLRRYGKDYVDQGIAKYEAKYGAQRMQWLHNKPWR
jgi:hypothetical protein